MEFLSQITNNTISFLLMLTVLVFIHELGHFLLARLNGVKVEVFSIGFGPEIWGFYDKYGTRWRFGGIPLGGYVKMFGEGDMVTGVDDTDERPMTDDEKKVSFHHKKLRQRVAIVAAGPAANFAFAILVLWSIYSVVGIPTVLSSVGEVIENTAAEDAGLQAGDVILSVDGQNITLFNELSDIVSVNANVPLVFEIQRGSTILNITATPRPWRGDVKSDDDEEDKDKKEGKDNGDDDDEVEDRPTRGLLGVRPDFAHAPMERKGIFEGLGLAVTETYSLSARILAGIGQMFSGERSAKELGGIIMLAEVSGNAVQGGLMASLWTLALISINLGLINLFPVPVLDGGHLMFYAAEAIRGKPLSAKLQEYGFRLGLILVLMLMLFATWNDFERLFERFGFG
ncbi:MAG: RIP metalloprotease RseP [Rhodospirillaceae bacterium]|nr:MAG: RIP metalloprotease RseP [Rhodospirillaceae bacterium]